MYTYNNEKITLKNIGISAPKNIKKQKIGKNNQNKKCFIEKFKNNTEIHAIINPKSNISISILEIPKSSVI